MSAAGFVEDANGPSEGDVSGVSQWAVNPDRTMVVIKESGCAARIGAQRLEPCGRATPSAPIWLVTPDRHEDWTILGWAAQGVVTLWHRATGHSLLRVVEVGGRDLTRSRVVGRPVECRIGQAGRVEVLVAVSNKARPLLCLHHPDTGSYRPLNGTEGVRAVATWNPATRVLAVNCHTGADEPTVHLLTYDRHEHTELDVAWPAGVRPVDAVGDGGDLIGLTGIDESGRAVPGLLNLPSGDLRWFGEHAGHSATGIAPSGRRLLVGAWENQQYSYRVLDAGGDQVGGMRPNAGIATDLAFTADEQHVLGWHQSPVRPPAIARWNVHTGREVSVTSSRVDRGPTVAMRWRHRWAGDDNGRALPEWLFEPERSVHRGVVLHLHGGPRSRLNQVYDPAIAALVDSGWTVVGMNYPGSSGYTMEYRELTIGDWGGADAEAIKSRLRALRTEVGDRPVFLYGHSYGGYLALLAASAAAQLVDGVAVWAPITDLPLLLASAAGTQRRWLENELGALRFTPQRLRERSPAYKPHALAELPLLVGHGGGDDRCPVGQSRRLVQILDTIPGTSGFIRYLEDPRGSHTPSDWRWWTDAVVAHLQQSISREPLDAGLGAAP